MSAQLGAVAPARLPDDVAGCYVHLPFCDRICPYCDFAVVRFERAKARRYLDALEREIARAPSPARPVRTIFLGGGTPSALAACDVARVLGLLFAKFGIAPAAVECTIEANPSRSAGDLAAWRAAGVTRLSIGVQSLDDRDLHRLGRDHTAAEALDFLAAARRAAFADIGIDLIAGAPEQTPASFRQTLERAIAAGPDHVSVYGLTVEPGTPYATWRARDPGIFPDDDAVAEMLTLAHDSLVAAGFAHYELSNFARPGHACEHNIGYWRQRECAAFGMSASGYEGGVRYRNARSFASYCAAVEAGASPRDEVEALDRAGRIGEAAMLALRMERGIGRDDFRRRFGVEIDDAFGDALKRCVQADLIEVDVEGARLTSRGRLLANEACAEFLAPRLAEAG